MTTKEITKEEIEAAFEKLGSIDITPEYCLKIDSIMLCTEKKCNDIAKLTEPTESQLHKHFTL